MGRPKKQKQPEPESESEEEVPEMFEDEEDEEDEMLGPYHEEDEAMYNEQLLEMIKGKAERSEEAGQKLTWSALYQLKQKEI